MNKYISTISMLIFAVILFTVPHQMFADGQGWLNHSMSFNIDGKLKLKFTTETRFHELTYMDPFLRNWQGGLLYSFSKNFYGGILFKRENEEKTDIITDENRITLEAGWKIKLGKSTSFDSRFRTEIRNYEEPDITDHLRFRLRLRLKTKVTIGKLKTSPFIAIEPFGDTKVDSINRYRFYLGTVFPLSKHVEWVVNYIRQGTRDKTTLDIINTGFEIKI